MNRKYITIGVLVVLLGGLVWFLISSQKHSTLTIPMSERVERPDMSLSFKYPEQGVMRVMEGGLSLGNMTMDGTFVIGSSTESAPVISAFVFTETEALFDESEVASGLVSTTTESEDSPVLDETKEEKIRSWLRANNHLTNYESARDESTQNLDGVTALRYKTSGSTYQQIVYAVIFRNRHYVFMGQFESANDLYEQQFEAFIDSIYFE